MCRICVDWAAWHVRAYMQVWQAVFGTRLLCGFTSILQGVMMTSGQARMAHASDTPSGPAGWSVKHSISSPAGRQGDKLCNTQSHSHTHLSAGSFLSAVLSASCSCCACATSDAAAAADSTAAAGAAACWSAEGRARGKWEVQRRCTSGWLAGQFNSHIELDCSHKCLQHGPLIQTQVAL